jgi:hypothetical protein
VDVEGEENTDCEEDVGRENEDEDDEAEEDTEEELVVDS